jgi:hypothetical protein
MPKVEERRNRSTKQLIASLIVDVDAPEGSDIYVIRAPIAGTERAKEVRSNLTMYGIEMTEGIGLTTDLELAKRITLEFPDYVYEELK